MEKTLRSSSPKPHRTPSRRRLIVIATVLLALFGACVIAPFQPTTARAAGQSRDMSKRRAMADAALAKRRTSPQRASAETLGNPPQSLSASAIRQIQAMQSEKAARTPAQRKMDSQLLYAMRMAQGKEVAPGVAKLHSEIEISNGMTRVSVRAAVTDATLALVKNLGGEVIRSFAFAKTIEANMPINQLEALAADGRVIFIAPPSKPILNRAKSLAPAPVVTPTPTLSAIPSVAERQARIRGRVLNAMAALKGAQGAPANAIAIPAIRAATAEGDIRHRARAARTAFNVDGAGLKIGILSDSFNTLNGLANDVLSGDLPGPGNPNGFTTPVRFAGSGDLRNLSGTDEGRAMAQIIHSVAPGAQLFFATASNSIEDFANNILALRGISPDPGSFGNVPDGGCDIIVDDIFYLVETGLHDGQSGTVISPFNMAIVNQAVADVTANGALYFSSAGNSGNVNDGTGGAWEGDFTSAGPAPGPLSIRGDALNWTPGAATPSPFNQIQSNFFTSLVTLQWSDPLGASTNDYDVFTFDSTGTSLFFASENIQDGTSPQDPFESTIGLPGALLVIVRNTGSAARHLSLSTNGGLLQFATPGQTRGHAATPGAIGVAATPTSFTFEGAPVTAGPAFPAPFASGNAVETFSSDGPRRSFFAPDGTPLGNGRLTVADGGGVVRQKPDVTAADGVPTTLGSLLNPFFGTSAAAPHACAIAALVKAAFIKNGNPNPTPAQIRAILQNTAADIEAPGPDRDSGFGILQAFQAVQATGLPGGAGIDFGDANVVEAVGGNQNGFVEPGETANLTLRLTNVGVVGATGVSATISTSAPGVRITTPTQSYGSIAPNGAATNAAPFVFALEPTAACGDITFTATVNFSGGTTGATSRAIRFRVSTGRSRFTVSNVVGLTPPPNPLYTASNAIQNGVLNPSGVTNACGASKPNPGSLDFIPTPVDVYTVMNNGPARCVTVSLQPPLFNNLDPNSVSTFLVATAYQSFNPAVPTLGYLGDAGDFAAPIAQPATSPFSFSFIAPANAPFTITVADFNVATNPANRYTLTVSGFSQCQAGGGAPVNVNNQTSLVTAPNPQVSAPTCGAQGYANDLIVNGTLTNVGATPLQNVSFQVVELMEADGTPPAQPFRLLSASGATCTSGGIVGAIQPLTTPTTLAPGQSAPIQFRIALPSLRRFRFRLNVLANVGMTASATSAPSVTQPLNLDVKFDATRKATVTAPAASVATKR
jgi:hypothetical protein